jgi:non-ribosomal peptide synthetase component F/acyl carrier protein
MDFVPLESGQTLLQLAPISFDASTFEIWGALLHGGRCVLYPDAIPTTRDIGVIIDTQGVTTLWLTASLFNMIIDEEPEILHRLRYLLTGGEALSVSHVLRALAQVPMIQLINGYGPTESTTFTCCYCIPASLSEDTRSIPLGPPIGNTQIYILDAHLNVVPMGVVGELYIGGDGLARGYVNRPELTADRFVPNPFSREPGARLYKAGDMVRYRTDGALEFCGRRDQQVKIRGHRIELGEIEAVLGGYPAVQGAVVVMRQDVLGEQCLVAYLVEQTGETLSSRELRVFLQERLPAYLIPSAFVVLDAFPLTPNGKVDRRALPEPQALQERDGRERAPARTPIEEMIQGLWKEVLACQEVGLDENFFELGGHSLLAAQLVGRLRRMLGVEISLRAIFEAPSVAALAQRVEQALRQNEASSLPPLQVIERPERLPLSFAQQRLWFLDQLEPESPAYLVPSVLKVEGQLDVSALERSVQELVSRHESLRTVFVEREGQPVQVIKPTAQVRVPVIDLQSLLPEQRAVQTQQLANQEGQRPCNLAQGPLLRLYLLRLEPEAHVMLLTLHHIITDGWSNEVLVRELTTLYRAFRAGQPSPLLPLPLQYADYALWQRSWLQGEMLQQQIAYWKKQLWRVSPLELPTDVPRTAVQGRRGAQHTFTLPDALFARCCAMSQQEEVTLFMTLLAAFQVLLARYSGQEDIVVGTDVANRTHLETEGLIGFFVNQLVVRSHVSGQYTFRELLHQVRKTTMDAYLHQDIPFEKIVEALLPDRRSQATPLFSVKMLLHVVSTEEASSQKAPDLSGVNVDALFLPLEMTAKLDLILRLIQTPKGMRGVFDYRADLFQATTIERMAQHFLVLLESICAKPDERLNILEMFTQQEKEERHMRRKEREATLSTKLKSVRPTSVRFGDEQLIRTEYLPEQHSSN